jgi:hypothetical protein
MSRVSHTIGGLFSVLALAGLLTLCLYLNDTHNRTDSDVVMDTILPDNGDLKIDWDRFQKRDISLKETLNITSSGVYHLTGSLDDNIININTVDGKVKLILDNVSIKNTSGPAINCIAADDLVIELVGKNTLEDGATYASSFDEEVSGVI